MVHLHEDAGGMVFLLGDCVAVFVAPRSRHHASRLLTMAFIAFLRRYAWLCVYLGGLVSAQRRFRYSGG